jgi:hypothetical protein
MKEDFSMEEEQKAPSFTIEKPEPISEPEIIEETREDKFKRLAQIRVNNILDEIELLDTLATNEYSYTPEQIQKMFNALENELQISKKKFAKHKMMRFAF